MDEVDVVLPCLDEAAALPGVLRAMPAGYRPLVVDNGSRDGSPVIARSLGAEVVCVLDADGSLDPRELPDLVALLARADLAVGRRVPEAGSWPWHARTGNAVLAALLRHKGLPVRDIAPMRAFRRQDLLDLAVEDRAFGYPLELLLLRAAAAGWRVVERDVRYGPRAAGTKSKVSGSVRGTVRAVRDMAAVLR
ncbi:glycosyltransferase family 2 protein [Saccharothrix isguenensis]